jgi:hypothetical protein
MPKLVLSSDQIDLYRRQLQEIRDNPNIDPSALPKSARGVTVLHAAAQDIEDTQAIKDILEAYRAQGKSCADKNFINREWVYSYDEFDDIFDEKQGSTNIAIEYGNLSALRSLCDYGIELVSLSVSGSGSFFNLHFGVRFILHFGVRFILQSTKIVSGKWF